MTIEQYRWRVEDNLACNSYDISAIFTDRYNKRNLLVSVETKELKSGEGCSPFLRVDKEGIQILFDELYNNGFRPTYEKSSLGKEEAMQGHIDDLRLITFKKLGIERP